MREIDLSNYHIRTDLITDIISQKRFKGITEKIIKIDGLKVSNVLVNDEGSKLINKKRGCYTTIFFDDVTDANNQKKLINVFTKELLKILKYCTISEHASCLIIGLGNYKSTPDSLGPLIFNNLIVTRHIYILTGSLEEGYRITSGLSPNVMGNTGIETKDIILGVVEKIKPDFIIAVDALASDSLDRVNKTIQISNTGIHPGSGVGNKREEISQEKLGIPVIAIGIPTVVDASTIVFDTINYMTKHFSYNIKNNDNPKLKFIPSYMQNYLSADNLTNDERKIFLGLVGTLSNIEMKSLLLEVLTPIGYNLMVTPKEIDFVIEKLSNVIANGINKALHNI